MVYGIDKLGHRLLVRENTARAPDRNAVITDSCVVWIQQQHNGYLWMNSIRLMCQIKAWLPGIEFKVRTNHDYVNLSRRQFREADPLSLRQLRHNRTPV